MIRNLHLSSPDLPSFPVISFRLLREETEDFGSGTCKRRAEADFPEIICIGISLLNRGRRENKTLRKDKNHWSNDFSPGINADCCALFLRFFSYFNKKGGGGEETVGQGRKYLRLFQK
ncbi:hypothetical protein HNY73_004974 [Argiope bruennichi]|uniref:Uncharacterized protein n=1 Tax=Argiope bruennichi TaxID=94029 RepID=A0A8T0FSA3_ARGBR|nr:hypothetical protein HNY73_004974 [Argiope bruennichi]